MPDHPEAPPSRSPFAPAAPVAGPEEPDVVVFEDLGYSPEELSPDAAGVVPLLLYWTTDRGADGEDIETLDSLGGHGFSEDGFVGGARRDGAWADPFVRAASWELGGGWSALAGMGQAEVVLDGRGEPEEPPDEPGPEAEEERVRAVEAERAQAAEAERARAVEAQRAQAAEAERARAVEERARAVEAQRARAVEAQRAQAAEAERARGGADDVPVDHDEAGELDLAAEAAALLSDLADAIATAAEPARGPEAKPAPEAAARPAAAKPAPEAAAPPAEAKPAPEAAAPPAAVKPEPEAAAPAAAPPAAAASRSAAAASDGAAAAEARPESRSQPAPPAEPGGPPVDPVPDQGGWLKRNVRMGSVLLRGLAKELTRKPNK